MDDPWFTYFRGRGKMQITPRNAKGWAALIAFILLITAPGALLPLLLKRGPWLLLPYLLFVFGLSFAFIRFAIARSERIDLDMTAAELEEFRAWKRRGKR